MCSISKMILEQTGGNAAEAEQQLSETRERLHDHDFNLDDMELSIHPDSDEYDLC